MEFKNYNIHKLIKISNLNVKVNINNGKHYLDIKSLNYTRKDEPIREKSSLSVKSDILDNKSINVKFNNVNRFRTLDFTGNNSSLKALVNTSSMVDKILVNNIELSKRSILLYIHSKPQHCNEAVQSSITLFT